LTSRIQDSSSEDALSANASTDVFVIQRNLRAELLDRPVIRHKPARDLAAHMLLNLDDLEACWDVATNWLRSELDCQRVDTGFGRPELKSYFPGFAQARNANYDVPSFGGTAVDNRDPIMQAMWTGSQAVVFADLKQDRRLTPGMRQRMSGAKTKSKFGAALRTTKGGYGLICADWTEHFVPVESGLFDCFDQTVSDVLSPIIAAAMRVAESGKEEPSQRHDDVSVFNYGRPSSVSFDKLTSSEIEIARLVVQGLSYKEIARIRGRAFSTIDHQLRGLRKKMGASSTANLVSLLAKLDAFSN
jgi:DNA-binding CsgD family transcriptional regulator